MPVADWFRRSPEPDLMARTLRGLTAADLAAAEADAHRQERDRHLAELGEVNRELRALGLPQRSVCADADRRDVAEVRDRAAFDLYDHQRGLEYAAEERDIDARSRSMTRDQAQDVIREVDELERRDAPDAIYPQWVEIAAARRAAGREGSNREPAPPEPPYNPAAEPGDADYREPRSDSEAERRTGWLDLERELAAPRGEPGPQARQPTALEDALVDAEIDAHYSALAHDGDPVPARRIQELEALGGLRPLPQPEPEQGLDQVGEPEQHAAPEREDQVEVEELDDEELER